MNVIQVKSYEELSHRGAVCIAAQVLKKPDSVLGLATGSTPEGTYQKLGELFRQGAVDFSRAVSFNLDEYWGIEPDDPQSYLSYMREKLFLQVNFAPHANHIPNGAAPVPEAECAAYDRAIQAAGGIDLQLLGLGGNGHIGFNEPADHFPAGTNHVRLAQETIDANSRFYKSRDEVPASALTMGIGAIMAARSILLLVSGEAKRDILNRSLFGPVTPQVPASILQFHPDVTVIHDFDL